MSRKFLCLCLFALTWAVCSATMAEEKHTSITTIAFNNGSTYDGANIPPEMTPVTAAIQKVYPDATFGVEQQVVDGKQIQALLVGLQFADAAEGKIAAITWKSNCATNSIYSIPVAQQVAIYKVLQPTVVAWTQAEHEHLGLKQAGVDQYYDKDRERQRDHVEVVLIKLAAK